MVEMAPYIAEIAGAGFLIGATLNQTREMLKEGRTLSYFPINLSLRWNRPIASRLKVGEGVSYHKVYGGDGEKEVVQVAEVDGDPTSPVKLIDL